MKKREKLSDSPSNWLLENLSNQQLIFLSGGQHVAKNCVLHFFVSRRALKVYVSLCTRSEFGERRDYYFSPIQAFNVSTDNNA